MTGREPRAHDHEHSPPPPLAGLSEEELYRLHIFHRVDLGFIRGKLDTFYGEVLRRQDDFIAHHIVGETVLDVGAGYGTLTRRLREQGLKVTPIDPHRESREMARQWFDVDVEEGDIYGTTYADSSFDTVVLREIGEHLDFHAAAPEIARLARRAVVLFHTNVTPLVRAARRVTGHHEFISPPTSHFVRELERVGFRVDVVRYRDPVAFPLSGGMVTRQLLPRWPSLYRAVLATDAVVTALARRVGLDRLLRWRVLIRAVRI